MAAQTTVKSVITCDMEGRIETFNPGAEAIFGYRADEVIGKKRVSLFSPGLTVLEHVPTWLKTASEEGEYKSQTVFIRKDGSRFAADVRITPTFRDGVQIGYCGVTVPLDDVAPEKAAQPVAWATRLFGWLVVTRAPFLTAIIIPMLIGASWIAWRDAGQPFPWAAFGLTLLAGISLHVAANTFNDYFDWKSGADQGNNSYFLPYSGGSRSIELGLISEGSLLRIAVGALLTSAVFGLLLAWISGPLVLLFGLIGAFSAFFYTAPPLRLAARRGLGELFTGLNFGPLAVAGTVAALTGSVGWMDFLVGLPIGFLVTAILWINQYPDLEADRAADKINLVVILGREHARWGYIALLLAAFGLVVYLTVSSQLPLGALLILGSLPLALYAGQVIWREYASRSLVRANAATIQLHMLAGLLFAVGLLISNPLMNWLGM